MLAADDFAPFFREIHGFDPFPWQVRLAQQVVRDGAWPNTLDLPTGTGKTAAIDIAVFHLALEAPRLRERRAPVRIAFVIDRRLVVDDAFRRATTLAQALSASDKPVTSRVSERLRRLSADGSPLIARRLRGGIPREDDWARTPAQPTVLCSTVDQIGSRLLFRGYGVSNSMKPVHAGLIGSDCLLLLDEVHLAEPFRQTLRWVQTYKDERWRETAAAAPWTVAFLSATPVPDHQNSFRLDDEDWGHPVLARRLNASKPARLVAPSRRRSPASTELEASDDAADAEGKNLAARVKVMADHVRAAVAHFQKAENGAPAPAICVVLNRVARARAVFDRLTKELGSQIEGGVIAVTLMIGPARQVDRDDLVMDLAPIRTRAWGDDEVRALPATFVLVATQCVEAGVDLDFDALITEAAPIDALRQRFGRLNRAGRKITPYAAIVASKSELASRYDDAVYGATIKPAWDYLADQPDGMTDGEPIVDFGIRAFGHRAANRPIPTAAISEKADAPVLLPAHVDLLSQTSPVPAADPDIALYLHGPKREPDSVTVVWRADLRAEGSEHDAESVRRILMLVPPRQGEAIELPLWAVRRFIEGATRPSDPLADVAAPEPTDEDRLVPHSVDRRVFRWKGDDERSEWVRGSDVRPGETVIVPTSYGGLDQFGWSPSTAPVIDRARDAARSLAGRAFAVRVAPGLLGSSALNARVADALAAAVSQRWRDLRHALLDLDLPPAVRADLEALGSARKTRVIPYLDVYGTDSQGRPRGIIFHAPFGIADTRQEGEGAPPSSEDDVAGSVPGFPLALHRHHDDVAKKVSVFAQASGFPADRVRDLILAGTLHDIGKADSRFQAWLHYGDPLGSEPDHLLAKSGRRLPRDARHLSQLPDGWRHEALSVRLACATPDLDSADDPELVLWLVGTHHGFGRPLFPHGDPLETVPDVGPQSLAFLWRGLDWPTIFERMKSRYGAWELARMEAVLRLADHRASDERAARATE